MAVEITINNTRSITIICTRFELKLSGEHIVDELFMWLLLRRRSVRVTSQIRRKSHLPRYPFQGKFTGTHDTGANRFQIVNIRIIFNILSRYAGTRDIT